METDKYKLINILIFHNKNFNKGIHSIVIIHMKNGRVTDVRSIY
jgi:hypothetical protein